MKTQGKVILAFLAMFLAGFLSGYFATDILDGSDGDKVEQRSERSSERQYDRQRMRERLISYLELTETQQDDFFREFNAYSRDIRNEIRNYRDEERQALRNRYAEMHQSMADILEAEQLEKLDNRMNPDSMYAQRRMRERR